MHEECLDVVELVVQCLEGQVIAITPGLSTDLGDCAALYCSALQCSAAQDSEFHCYAE